MTTYRIEFVRAAEKEWRKLDPTIKVQLEKKLREIAQNPHIPSARLKGVRNAYRIKARSAGYRLIYRVQDDIVTVFVIAIGKRERGEVFEIGIARIGQIFGDE